MDHPLENHEVRKRRAHIAEIKATPDWSQFGSGDTAESLADNQFVERKGQYTRDGGRNAPWSTGDAAAIADRIQTPGSVAHDAYYGNAAMPDPRDSMSAEERAALTARIRANRAERLRAR